MVGWFNDWLSRQRLVAYQRKRPLVLINGLAEQAETWFCNADRWRRRFTVHMPVLAAYDGQPLHRRLEAGLPIDVDFLVEQLRLYLDSFVSEPPYDLAANSMGGKVAVEFAVRYPQLVRRLVLLCPSGLADREHLPIVEGVRRSDLSAVIGSVFHRRRSCPRLVQHYQSRLTNKRWRTGLLRTIRGTMDHCVRDRLAHVAQPTLLVVGEEDRIVDPRQSIEAGKALKNGRIVILPNCGHAPQIECAATINRLVEKFLTAHEQPQGEWSCS
jgi:pimeloyl-ACP methyl ester carboxylesterase